MNKNLIYMNIKQQQQQKQLQIIDRLIVISYFPISNYFHHHSMKPNNVVN